MEKKTLRGLNVLSLISQIGLIMVISITLGIYLGRLLDVYFQTRFLFTLVLLLGGAGGGFVAVYRLIESMERQR